MEFYLPEASGPTWPSMQMSGRIDKIEIIYKILNILGDSTVRLGLISHHESFNSNQW